MDVEFEDVLVHFGRFGKADGFSLHAFEMSAKVEVFSFNVLRAVFSDLMAFGRQHFGVALPVVSVETPHLARGQFLAEFAAVGISAASQDKGGDMSDMAIETIPKPHLLSFVLHKTPLFIHLQSQNTQWHTRFGRARRCLAQHTQHGCRADTQHAGNVTDARTIERHRHNLLALQGIARSVAVNQAKQKRLAALFAPISLLALARCAMLYGVAQATPRTGHFKAFHISQSLSS